MSIQPLSPGVYIQEASSGVHTIIGVPTSIAAFIDFFPSGEMNQPTLLLGVADLDRLLGGINANSEASYAIQQFFLNGGQTAYAVRVAKQTTDTGSGNVIGPAPAGIAIGSAAGTAAPTNVLPASWPASGGGVIQISAVDEGVWGQQLTVRVDRTQTVRATTQFNISVTEWGTVNGRLTPVAQETFTGLSLNPTQSNYAVSVINDPDSGSSLISVAVPSGSSGRPLANGTIGGPVSATPTIATSNPSVNVTITGSGGTAVIAATQVALTGLPTNAGPVDIAAALQAGIRALAPANPLVSGTVVDVVREGTGSAATSSLRTLLGPGDAGAIISYAAGSDTTTAAALNLLAGSSATSAADNVQSYALGATGPTGSAQVAYTLGNDGAPPGAAELIGDAAQKTGIYALENVDLFNLLSIPRLAATSATTSTPLGDNDITTVAAVAEQYCDSRRAFFLLDPPTNILDPRKIKDWMGNHDSLRDGNAAVFFPPVMVPDPLDGYRLKARGPSGTLAGLFARTDVSRGVWKAPAGTEATLTNVPRLGYVLNDAENGLLNPLGINCLRTFPIYGNVCWGSRTLYGADEMGSEWKYIPIRRLALFLEESLFRGTKWVVFEPNDEPLWAKIRLNVGAFMHGLFIQGAFRGGSAKDAYLVKCDSSTTTPADQDAGIVNIVVGFAPLEPAEFVIITIQQIASQLAT